MTLPRAIIGICQGVCLSLLFGVALTSCQKRPAQILEESALQTPASSIESSTSTPLPAQSTSVILTPSLTLMPSELPSATLSPSPTIDPAWWISSTKMPYRRGEAAVGMIDGKIYVPGGMVSLMVSGGAGISHSTNVLAIYNSKTDTWTTGSPHPVALNHFSAAAFDGKLYTFGGWSEAEVIIDGTYIYDPAQDNWTQGAPAPFKRNGGSAVALGEYIYYFGGYGGSLDTWSILRYHPADDTWEISGKLNQLREHVSAVALDGKIYILGGRWDEDLASVEIYDPETQQTQPGPPMNEPRAGFAAVVIDGKIYVAGGEQILGKTPRIVSSVEMFDPSTGRWSVVSQMPVPLHGVSGANISGVFYLVAGSPRPNQLAPFSQVITFTP